MKKTRETQVSIDMKERIDLYTDILYGSHHNKRLLFNLIDMKGVFNEYVELTRKLGGEKELLSLQNRIYDVLIESMQEFLIKIKVTASYDKSVWNSAIMISVENDAIVEFYPFLKTITYRYPEKIINISKNIKMLEATLLEAQAQKNYIINKSSNKNVENLGDFYQKTVNKKKFKKRNDLLLEGVSRDIINIINEQQDSRLHLRQYLTDNQSVVFMQEEFCRFVANFSNYSITSCIDLGGEAE